MKDVGLLLAIVIGFPVVFVAIWSGVCALLAFMSGYRSLLPRFAEPETAAGARQLPSPLYARVGLVSYRGGLLHLDATSGGLGLQVSSLFPFHPPVRVPWALVAIEGRRVVLDRTVTLHLPQETFTAVEQHKARYVAAR